MCHIDCVTLFNFTLQRGVPVVEQVLFAALRSILKGEYRPGDPFPSVRAMAANLKIHPNTAHKVIQMLIEERWLEAQTGIGTAVAARPTTRSADAIRKLRADLERLVVKARSGGLSEDELIEQLRAQWRSLGSS